MTVICEISALLTDADWAAPSPCPEWRVADLAGHLRCVADDFHEYLDDAPASRLARLMATGAHPDTLARKLARQNAAELAALPDASGPEHIAAFASSARSYAQRLLLIWDLPHHQYRDTLVTVGGMAGAACAEWHLHAWDLARAQGKDYRPANPDILLRGWLAGKPHLPLPVPGLPVAVGGTHVARATIGGAALTHSGDGLTDPSLTDPTLTVPSLTDPRLTIPRLTDAVLPDPGRPAGPGAVGAGDPWHAMLRASGRTGPGGSPADPGLVS